MNKSMLVLAAAVLLTATVHAGFGAEATHVPATPQAAANANLIARADHALRAYVDACSVEAAALSANLSGDANEAASQAHISNLWIFPTNDSNAVFVQYTMSSGVRSAARLPGSEHLALLEMRGDQIVKMLDFIAGAGRLPSLETRSHTGARFACSAKAHD